MTWSNDEKNIVEYLNTNIFNDEKLIYEGKHFSSFDAHNSKYTCEIKKRNFRSYHRYAQAGLILEKKKYDKLIEKSKYTNTEALYINLFIDDKVFIWNLTKLTNEGYEFKWHNMKMNKATFRSVDDKVEKSIALLKEDITFNVKIQKTA